MANPDRPKGFTPVKTLWGAPWNSMVRSLGVADSADIFRGDPIKLSSGRAAPAASGDTVLGVAIGFGRDNNMHADNPGMFDPSNLETRFYDDSANTHTEWTVWYVPAEGVIFEAQSATDLDASVGDVLDFDTGAGDSTTGLSGKELTTKSDDDVVIVEIPKYPDNDSTLANTRYWVIFDKTAYLAESAAT